tara:strand:+ start:1250 stop:1840 length:591 start_codon:yes stop_codon:yes gene_type:complete
MAREPNYRALVDWLDGTGRNVHSQFGEDGLIESVLARIGERNRCCFEVGAHDGVFLSNTKLLRDDGWRALLIESMPDLFDKLKTGLRPNETAIHETATPENIEGLLTDANMPIDLDVGIIDIDGQDYWMFNALKTFRPRVLVVEYSPYVPGDVIPDPGGEGQATLQPIIDLAESKDYEPLAVTYCNVVLADKGELK